MAKQTKITVNLKGLEDLRKQLGNEYVTRVGVLGGKVSRHDGGPMTNADIGVVHEFGSESANIPARSFLRMPVETHGKEITKAMGGAMVKKAVESGNIKQVYQILGVVAERIVDDAFATGGFGQWPVLQQSTIDKKGSSAILIDTAELRRSISSDVKRKGEL